MPVHRVPINDDLERAVESIEQRERVVSTEKAGDGCVLVFTELRGEARVKPGTKETRA